MSTPDQGSNRDNDPDADRADFDRRFGEIVAGFEPHPHAEDEAHDQAALEPTPAPETPHTPIASEGEAGPWREWSDPGEEDHFVPAPTDPLPAGDLHFWGIVVGLTVGPLLILLTALFSAVGAIPWGVLGIAGTVIGFVLLVLRSPTHRSGDDGSGARV
ncbi:MAG: hypothetical protein WA880_05805 [Ornithinimicrobium sp.]